jgi:hypothetical protein
MITPRPGVTGERLVPKLFGMGCPSIQVCRLTGGNLRLAPGVDCARPIRTEVRTPEDSRYSPKRRPVSEGDARG